MELDVPDYVVLIVAELGRSLDFYVGTLGLRLQHRSGPYAQLDTGRTRLALYERGAMAKTLGVETLSAPDTAAPGFELGFKVADADAVYADLLAAGAEPAAPPTDRHWGQRTAYIRDPDGHLIELAADLGRTSGARPGRTSGARPGRTSGARPGRTSGARPDRTSGARPDRSGPTQEHSPPAGPAALPRETTS